MDFFHAPIMVKPIIELLKPCEGKIFVDCTLGGGGHSEELLRAGAVVYGIDRDEEAINSASERLAKYGDRFTAIRGNYADIKRLVDFKADGILADLGVSSYQLDNPERGFSYNYDAPLDMRMDRQGGLSAHDVVNTYSQQELTRILKEYGEEKWASRIAQFIVAARPLNTTFELVEVIKNAIPASARRDGPHPAKRSFQAIRIEVNGELDCLAQAVRDMVDCLKSKGRIGIITFHSLEDRIVKTVFRSLETPCICPPKTPICICGAVPTIKTITKKPIVSDEEELDDNHRARSAKLRVAQKL